MLLVACVERASCSLLIGAFNIRSFGDNKASNITLMDIIVKVVQRYDIILIQEVRDSDLSATNTLMRKLNSGSQHVYRHIVSDPLGRSTYTERYLFIYRDERVSVIDSYHYDDGCEPCGNDTFNREPFVVKFSSPHAGTCCTHSFIFLTTSVREFAIVPQHTSPSDAVQEIDALYDVCMDLVSRWQTDNILLMGDFNAGCSYVTPSNWPRIRLRTDPQFQWLIPDSADTTVTETHCPYDRIVASGSAMKNTVSPGSAVVYDFQTVLKLTQDQVRVSFSFLLLQLCLHANGI
ncbi:deoxyribonuclease-1 [Polyodon spathula]|uniref:deoxyribonuclease-1 n=1 Tax=Polyodon spathula TaxID=7913 RepID=UPI001B7F6896|nr:deoxyribonuclease-1 [Polyodon spathula]